MASGTIELSNLGSNSSGSYIVGQIKWTSTPIAGQNRSTLEVKLYVRKDNDSMVLNTPTEGTWSYALNINGTKYNGSQYKSVLTEFVYVIGYNLTVPHDSNGSKSITISGTITGPSETSLAGLKASDNETVTLDTIPQATKINKVEFSGGYVDGNIVVSYTPQKSTYYHKCIFSVNVDGTLTKIRTDNVGKASATSLQKYIAPKFSEEKLSEIYSKVTKTDSAKIRVTLQTYSDSNYSNKVGNDQVQETYAKLPDSISPTVELELKPVNNTYSWLGSNYVAGFTEIKAKMTATPGINAEILSTAIGYNGATYNGGDATTFTVNIPPVSKPGEIYLAATAIDSRNRYTAETGKITVLPYSAPVITRVEIVRGTYNNGWKADENGGDVEVSLKSTLALADVGNTYDVTFKVDGSNKSPSDSETHGLASGVDCTVYLRDIGGDESHTLIVTATDMTNNKGTVKLTIPTRHITMEFNKSGKGIAFGKTSEEEVFECAWDAKFYGTVKSIRSDGSILTLDDTGWIDLGLSDSVTTTSRASAGHYNGCAYRVVNGNHVYVAFNCRAEYSGSAVTVSGARIPTQYTPKLQPYAIVSLNGKRVARILVSRSTGHVIIDWIHNVADDTDGTYTPEPEVHTATWIDGYIDYFI